MTLLPGDCAYCSHGYDDHRAEDHDPRQLCALCMCIGYVATQYAGRRETAPALGGGGGLGLP